METSLKALLEELQALQDEVIKLVNNIPENDLKKQFHADLSPLGWHLGHCVFIELYWIKEQCLNETIDDALKSLYFPELSDKPSRGAILPDKEEMLAWVKQTQFENRELLKTLFLKNEDTLLKNYFLIHFLIQHYSQHIETMVMVLTERQKQQSILTMKPVMEEQQSIHQEFVTIKTGIYEVGTNNIELTYDNERPLHKIKLNQFSISNLPVSNKEYKLFMQDGGYSNKDLWSKQGWAWINKSQYKHPHHWHLDKDATYLGIDHDGKYILEEERPVYGLSYYEAEAYANWKGLRLPHEHEWEVAATNQYLHQNGLVWEWCSNHFYPYKNFEAFPYDGYSVPYFDHEHYVLRGGSCYSKKRIKRTTFRNYYTADKRHIFAGLRLVKD